MLPLHRCQVRLPPIAAVTAEMVWFDQKYAWLSTLMLTSDCCHRIAIVRPRELHPAEQHPRMTILSARPNFIVAGLTGVPQHKICAHIWDNGQWDCDTLEGCIVRQRKAEDGASVGRVEQNGDAEAMRPLLVIGDARRGQDVRGGGATARLRRRLMVRNAILQN